MSCEDCDEAHELDGVEPPCDECRHNAPAEPLWTVNQRVWEAWRLAHGLRDPFSGGLSPALIAHLAGELGLDADDLAALAALERHVRPLIEKRSAAHGTAGSD